MATPLAQAYVRIRARGDELRNDIRSQAGQAARAAAGPAGTVFGQQFSQAATAAMNGRRAQLDLDLTRARQRIDELVRLRDTALDRKPDLDLAIVKAEQKIARLKALMGPLAQEQTLRVDAEIAKAEADIRRLKAQRDELTSGAARLRFDAEIAAAVAKVEALEAAKRRLEQPARFRVIADTGNSVGSIRALYVAIAALIPIAVAAAGAIAGIGAVGIVGIGAAIAGFAGVGTAVKAMGDKASAGGGAVKVSAAAVRSAAAGVRSAQQDYAHALEDVTVASRNAARAQQEVAAAQRDVDRAAVNVRLAMKDQQRAQADLAGAQRDLNAAYADAVRNLRDLQLASEDMALSQEDAALSVAEAEERLMLVTNDPTSTENERKRAELSVRIAKQRTKDLAAQASDLAAKKADADSKGVANADVVVAAQQRVADAQDRVEAATLRVADAQQAVIDAQQRVVDAQARAEDATRAVARAHEDVANALDRVKEAQLRLNEAQHPEQAGGGGGVDALAQAMAKLTPQGQAFATFLRSFLDGPLKQLGDAGQAAFLPGVQSGMQRLIPIMDQIKPSFAAFSGTLGKALGDLIPIAGSLAKPFLDFANSALKGLAPLGPVLQRFATSFGAILERLASSGIAEKAMNGLVQMIDALLPLIGPLADAGTQIMAALGPSLATVIQSLVQAFTASLLPALVKLAPVFGDLLAQIAPLIPTIFELIPPLVDLALAMAPLLPPAIELITLITKMAVQFIVALMPAVTAFVSILVSLYGVFTDSVMPAIRAFYNFFEANILPVMKRGKDSFELAARFVKQLAEDVGRVAGQVKDKTSQMFEPMRNAFRTAINFIISGWNRLNFSVPSFDFLGQTIGGFSVGVGHIQPLAKGGIATDPTLALIAEAGQAEAVAPLSDLNSMIRAAVSSEIGNARPVPAVAGDTVAAQASRDETVSLLRQLIDLLTRPAEVRLDNRLVGAVDFAYGRGGI